MADYNKKSWIQKKLLKLKDIEEYKNYKYATALRKIQDWPVLDIPKKDFYSFKHSGNAGDIIYSLATVKALCKDSSAHIFFNLGQRGEYGKKAHPLGNVMFNETMFNMLKPLVLHQPYVNDVQKFEGNMIVDYDLDMIRRFPIKLAMGDIARWYFYLYGMNADLGQPWITADANPAFKDHIIVARSQRYRQPLIDYSFLKGYKKIIFIGVEVEYQDMKEMIPHIEFIKVNDFLELASMVAGCRFFIGNQSFPFSIAEALKVNRILESYHLCPNVVVEGPKGYDFCYQPQFEKIVADMLRRTE